LSIYQAELVDEARSRYISYALSVVSHRALPDVRDGLKPVQRRILYSMFHDLHLDPEKLHRKSAAVIGEVLGRYHPHGDAACYDAMVRMAQDFIFRYPLVDGQGNFGSLDGDAPAAYRYTEARLTAVALEVVGDISQKTVQERPNFDQTTNEPVVLPSRVPHLLMNGASGIAVGMATAIPPHNLKELIKALILLLEDDEASTSKLLSIIKGPDFPTGCQILNSREELKAIYDTGRGSIRMRADYVIEEGNKGKKYVIVKSVPYGVEKSAIVSKIADLIIARKVPQFVDVRDESTDDVRIVIELSPAADPDKGMSYLFKHTQLQSPFHVNLTALIPTENPMICKPEILTLKEMLLQFIKFRVQVTRSKLEFEKAHLEKRVHLLNGLLLVFKNLDEVIAIVRKSDGRSDAIAKLKVRFKLSDEQASFLVDLRIYQLSRTSLAEIQSEKEEKERRIEAIDKILKSEKNIKKEIETDLTRIGELFGDKRRCEIVSEFTEEAINEEEFIQHEDVFVIVTKDGWLKRLRVGNDPTNTRIRDGDQFLAILKASTKDTLALFSSRGNLFVLKVFDLLATPGFGEPVQKRFKFQDGETLISAFIGKSGEDQTEANGPELILASKQGLGFRFNIALNVETNRNGRRIMKLADNDKVSSVELVTEKSLLSVSSNGFVVLHPLDGVPILGVNSKGVILQKIPEDDELVCCLPVSKSQKLTFTLSKGEKEIVVKEVPLAQRIHRGTKLLQRNTPVLGVKRPFFAASDVN
jgi:DNA gyrase subunit A